MAYDPNQPRNLSGEAGGEWSTTPTMGLGPAISENSPLISHALSRGQAPSVRRQFDKIARVLTRLVVRSKVETATVLAMSGEIGPVNHGDSGSVAISQRMIEFIRDQPRGDLGRTMAGDIHGAEIHHSHPAHAQTWREGLRDLLPGHPFASLSSSLSDADLKAAVRFRAASIIAHSQDGSIYQGAMTQLGRIRMTDRAYHEAFMWAADYAEIDLGGPMPRASVGVPQLVLASHMTNIRLRDEGYLDYRFKLSPTMRDLVSTAEDYYTMRQEAALHHDYED